MAANNQPHGLMCWLALLSSAAMSSGCGSGDGQRFVPSEESAQATLESALTVWQNGKTPPCPVREGTPAVQLVDTHHKSGQKLTAFKVLGPTTGDAKRCYAVRLTFDNPSEEVRARYVVLGLDPLWVMRYEDFEMVAHWDHPVPEKSSSDKQIPARKPQS